MTIIYTTKDSRTSENNPTTNYGSLEYVSIDGESGYEYLGYFGFDISSIDVGTVTAATLYLNCSLEGNDTIYVHRITSSWTESGITWNISPSYTATNSTSFPCTTTGWKSVNILSMLQDESSTEFGVRLSSNTTILTRFHTKEYDSGSEKAYLDITGGILTGDKYVDIATGSDSDNGNTWGNAYLTVKKGIDYVAAGKILHIAEGDYSAQAAIDLNKNLELLCEDYGGGNASPPLTVVLPITT